MTYVWNSNVVMLQIQGDKLSFSQGNCHRLRASSPFVRVARIHARVSNYRRRRIMYLMKKKNQHYGIRFFFRKTNCCYLTCGTLVANLHSLFWLPVQKDTLLLSVRLKTLKTIPAHRSSGLSYQECLFDFSFWLCHNIL